MSVVYFKASAIVMSSLFTANLISPLGPAKIQWRMVNLALTKRKERSLSFLHRTSIALLMMFDVYVVNTRTWVIFIIDDDNDHCMSTPP